MHYYLCTNYSRTHKHTHNFISFCRAVHLSCTLESISLLYHFSRIGARLRNFARRVLFANKEPGETKAKIARQARTRYFLGHRSMICLPEVVLEGNGIRLAPFLLDRLGYDRDVVNDALGIFQASPCSMSYQSVRRLLSGGN